MEFKFVFCGSPLILKRAVRLITRSRLMDIRFSVFEWLQEV